jgi:hypothetical protein
MWFLKKRFFELLRRDGVPSQWEAKVCLDLIYKHKLDFYSWLPIAHAYAHNGDLELTGIMHQRTSERVRQIVLKACRVGWRCLRDGK